MVEKEVSHYEDGLFSLKGEWATVKFTEPE
jgi:hypothetical protein